RGSRGMTARRPPPPVEGRRAPATAPATARATAAAAPQERRTGSRTTKLRESPPGEPSWSSPPFDSTIAATTASSKAMALASSCNLESGPSAVEPAVLTSPTTTYERVPAAAGRPVGKRRRALPQAPKEPGGRQCQGEQWPQGESEMAGRPGVRIVAREIEHPIQGNGDTATGRNRARHARAGWSIDLPVGFH